MKRTNKKGFTIVELVIVIAVIAILAAVLIPTYSSLVKKANQSADIQAVREMNTALAMNEVTKGKTINEVYDALAEAGMTAKDYIPLTDGNHFYWIGGELNRVVYTDKNDKVIFPEEHKDKTLEQLKGTYSTYSVLSGIIGQTKVEVENGVAKDVDTAEKLFYLSQNMPADLKEIQLAAGTIDLKGANISFVLEENAELKISGTTENGKTTTLTGMVANDNKLYGDGSNNKDYAAGFIGLVKKGATVTIENIVIDGATVGTTNIGGVGALIGRIDGGDKATSVTITNCTVKNTTVTGRNKVAALVGSVGGNVTLKVSECTVEDVTVNCSEGESGKVIGCVYNNGTTVSIDREFSQWVKGKTTLNLVADKYTRTIVDTTGKTISCTTGTNFNVTNCQKLISIYDESTRCRMFADDAYMTVFQNSTEISVTINNSDWHASVNTMKSHTENKQTVYDKNAKIGETEYIINMLYILK